MLTVIPFSGFYYTGHDDAMDHALNMMFCDDYGNAIDGLVMRAFDAIDWTKAQQRYAKAYAQSFAAEFGIKLEFESLNSPREYNFTTDRIFCNVSIREMMRIRRETPAETLADVAREMFTSRSGFISHYSPDVSTWGALRKWDHNQCLCLLQAYVNARKQSERGRGFSHDDECALMEWAGENGNLDNWLWESADSATMRRLDRVYTWLRERAQ